MGLPKSAGAAACADQAHAADLHPPLASAIRVPLYSSQKSDARNCSQSSADIDMSESSHASCASKDIPQSEDDEILYYKLSLVILSFTECLITCS